jgi:hypothetical protein
LTFALLLQKKLSKTLARSIFTQEAPAHLDMPGCVLQDVLMLPLCSSLDGVMSRERLPEM